MMSRGRKIFGITPVVLFIIARWVFDAYSPSLGDFAEITLIDNSPAITNWQVFYYIALDVAWIIYLLYLESEELSKNFKNFYWILTVSFSIDIFINTLKIGMDFEEYVVSIGDIEQNILVTGLISAILIVFLFKVINLHKYIKKWLVRLLKK